MCKKKKREQKASKQVYLGYLVPMAFKSGVTVIEPADEVPLDDTGLQRGAVGLHGKTGTGVDGHRRRRQSQAVIGLAKLC